MPEQNQFKMKLSQVTSPGSSNPSIPPTTDYYNVHEAADDSLSLALIIARAADERKAANIEILKVGEVSYLTNYFIIMTGFSKVQLRGISNAIKDQG
jgi:ribosome-associated protein